MCRNKYRSFMCILHHFHEFDVNLFESVFAWQPLRTEAVVSETEPEESLGPIEPPYPSPRFKRNYTVFLTQVCYLILPHI
jgi:hypothetical protein